MTDATTSMPPEEPHGRLGVAARILRNMSFLTVSKVLGDLVTFLLFVVLSRKFGQDGLGAYLFAMSYTGFVLVLADFGLYYYSIREMSRYRERMGEIYGRVLTLRVLLSVTAGLLFAASVPLLTVTGTARLVVLEIAVYHLFYGFVLGYTGVFVAREEMATAGAIELSTRVLAVAGTLAVVFLTGNLAQGLIAFPVAALVTAVAAHFLARRRVGPMPMPWFDRSIRSMLRSAAPFGGIELLQQLATRLDLIFLGFMLGMAAAGVYGTAYRIIAFFYFLLYFVTMAIYPIASRAYLRSREEFRTLYNDALRAGVMVVVPAAVGLYLVAPELIPLVFSDAFIASVPVLQLLSVLVFVVGLRHLMSMFLMACDRQVANTKAQWVAVVLNAVGNLILIPIMGPMGAAVATVVSESVVVVLFAFALRDVVGFPHIGSRLLIAGIGSAVFLIVGDRLSSLAMWAVIPLAVVLYGGTVLLFKDVRSHELRALRQMLAHARDPEPDTPE